MVTSVRIEHSNLPRWHLVCVSIHLLPKRSQICEDVINLGIQIEREGNFVLVFQRSADVIFPNASFPLSLSLRYCCAKPAQPNSLKCLCACLFLCLFAGNPSLKSASRFIHMCICMQIQMRYECVVFIGYFVCPPICNHIQNTRYIRGKRTKTAKWTAIVRQDYTNYVGRKHSMHVNRISKLIVSVN